ncbi:hypothetical protein F5Y08DRAFT_100163 [Xylaria arbuscula]|uniref:2EXR domain-containing protein n=1 Tax=Xylaria arbuscula TaxID=114810 RepID=A0A9W8NDP7_9PEZI|nr:hypothetical protein F5Y08DRAFT_100163 [Xylaria arbuscula]KAJ3570636.1 hypothetical protein NPX13_g5666 [Xylaria arbuscula]
MASPTSFPSFSLLPAELRLQIWRASCHRRVVEVFYDSANRRCTTTTPVPAILHTCRESRCEALRVYKKSFGTTSHEPRIYFSREIDTLYIPRPPFMGYDDSARSFVSLIRDMDCIVHLAIDYVPPSIKRPWETYNKYILIQSCPFVQEVFLVTGIMPPSEDHHVGELDLADPTRDPSSSKQLLEDVKASFYYETLDQFDLSDRDAKIEPLHLPPLILKSKIWTHP